MWLQKNINKWLIKRALWSKYVYEIEAEEKAEWIINKKNSAMTEFLKWWLNEMKKDAKKLYENNLKNT